MGDYGYLMGYRHAGLFHSVLREVSLAQVGRSPRDECSASRSAEYEVGSTISEHPEDKLHSP
jgi:hypothetical protein